MSSSLAGQLWRLATSGKTGSLGEERRRPSLLFDPKTAATLDAAALLNIGREGLRELLTIDPAAFQPFQETLFADSSARVQRLILGREENARLDAAVERWCVCAGPYFRLAAVHKCLEWLVYRFSVHRHSATPLLLLALPHHDTNFARRLLQVVEISEDDGVWGWLRPLQKAELGLQRQALLNRCLSDPNFLSLVAGAVHAAVEVLGESAAETGPRLELLVGFTASTLVQAIAQAPALSETHISTLVPHLAAGLKSRLASHKLGCLMVTAQLALSASLSSAVVGSLLKLILRKARRDNAEQSLTTVLVLCQSQTVAQLPPKALQRLVDKWDELGAAAILRDLGGRTEIAPLFTPLLEGLLGLESKEADAVVQDLLLQGPRLSDACAQAALKLLQRGQHSAKDEAEGWRRRFGALARRLATSYPAAFDSVCTARIAKLKAEAGEGQGKGKRLRALQAFARLCDLPTLGEDSLPLPDPQAMEAEEAGEESEEEAVAEPSPKRRREAAKPKPKPDEAWLAEASSRLEEAYHDAALDRLASLVADLERVLKLSDDLQRRGYVLQLVLSSLKRLQDSSEKAVAEALRTDLLVRALRDSKAPPVTDVLLHLLSAQAKVWPERVLEQVMSVFTFWGRGLVRRDDAYSAQLLDSTLQGLVPSLLREPGSGEISQRRLLSVLRAFAAALPDAPLHRRLGILRGLRSAALGAAEEAAERKGTDEDPAWLLLVLCADSHVSRWAAVKAEAKAEAGALHSELELLESLLAESSAKAQMATAQKTLEYLHRLDEGLGDPDRRAQGNGPEVVETSKRSLKELWHLNYVLVGLVARVLSSEQLLEKLSDEGAADAATQSQSLLEAGLELRSLALRSSELATSAEAESEAKFWRALVKRCDEALQALCSLLPADSLLQIISGLLGRQSPSVRKNGMDLLNAKLLQTPTPFTQAHVPGLVHIAGVLNQALGSAASKAAKAKEGPMSGADGGAVQAVAYSLKLLVRVAGRFETAAFEASLAEVVRLLGQGVGGRWAGPVTGSVVLCLGELVAVLGPKSLPKVPEFVPQLVQMLAQEKSEVILISALTAAQRVVDKLAAFLGPTLPDLLVVLSSLSARLGSMKLGSALAQHGPHRLLQSRKLAAALPSRALLPALAEAFDRLAPEKPEELAWLLGTLADHVADLKGAALSAELGPLADFLLHSLELRSQHSDRSPKELDALEEAVLSWGVRLMLKQSEATLRPFLFRLSEWAGEGLQQKEVRERLTTTLRLATALAQELKGLFLLFAGSFVTLAAKVLPLVGNGELFRVGASRKASEWSGAEASEAGKADALSRAALGLLAAAGRWDEKGSFFTAEKLEGLRETLLGQTELHWLPPYEARVEEWLGPAVAAVAAAGKDETGLKTLNYALLSRGASKRAGVRAGVLGVARQLYEAVGAESAALVAETVPFLAEALEDGDAAVEAQAQALLRALEDLTGERIHEYF